MNNLVKRKKISLFPRAHKNRNLSAPACLKIPGVFSVFILISFSLKSVKELKITEFRSNIIKNKEEKYILFISWRKIFFNKS